MCEVSRGAVWDRGEYISPGDCSYRVMSLINGYNCYITWSNYNIKIAI